MRPRGARMDFRASAHIDDGDDVEEVDSSRALMAAEAEVQQKQSTLARSSAWAPTMGGGRGSGGQPLDMENTVNIFVLS